MIRLEDYLLRVQSITEQYEYARYAIKGFIASIDPEALTKIKHPPIALEAFLNPSDEEFLNAVRHHIEELKGGFPEDKKDLENRLAQNEIILLVAVFEDQLKSIHKEILRQNPKLLSADREISLGRLAALGGDAIIAEEIERAVQLLDRLSLKEKAKAFAKIGFPWKANILQIEMMITLRNTILHEDTNQKVSSWDLMNARIQALSLPAQLYWDGFAIYPSAFPISEELVKQRNAVTAASSSDKVDEERSRQ